MRSLTAQAMVQVAARFGRETIAANAESWDAARHVPRTYFTQAAELGLCRLLTPTAQGGLGLPLAAVAEITQTLARECMASTFALVVHNNLAASIALHGTPAQIERHLAPMLRGEIIGAFLLTEPQVGSDAAAIETQAQPDGAGWILNGRKAWVSNGANADLLSVYAQTEPGAGARGIACFLVDARAPGVNRTPPYELLGGHALGTSGFDFTQCRVDGDALMLAPGQAFRAALGGIDMARVNVAAMCCGILARALAEAITFTGARRAFGQAVRDFQGVQWLLAEAATDLEAARLLTAAAAQLFDAGKPATLAAAHAKKFASRVAFTRIAECMQTMGAAGFSRDYPLARHLAAAKMAQYLDGATEIQNVVIARALASAYGDEAGQP